MSSLLKGSGISLPLDEGLGAESVTIPVFEYVDGSVLLRQEFEGAQHVKASDFPDRTGYECFINHVHLPFAQTRESLVSCLRYAIAVRSGLARLQPRRNFQIIVSVGEVDCTVQTGFGNIGRNQFRGPGYFDTDLTIKKAFSVTKNENGLKLIWGRERLQHSQSRELWQPRQ